MPAVSPSTAIPAPGTAGIDAEGTAEAGETEGEEGEDANTDAEAGEAAEGEEAAENNEPQKLQQIGDEEVPLANLNNDAFGLFGLDNDFAKIIGDFPLAAKIGICSAILLAISVAAWFLLIRNRKKQIEIE